MLFGTAKRLATTAKSLEVKYKEKSINFTTSYKYLVVKLDPTMTMQEHFNSTYKRASSRLSLLSKRKNLLTDEVAKRYTFTMILPVMTYCCLINLKSTETQKKRLESLDSRSKKIVNGNAYVIRIQDYKKGMPANLLEEAWMVHAVKILTIISQNLNTAKTLETTNIS